MKPLQAIYDTHKSYYNKAKTEETNGKLVLYSYDTEVAFIENNKAVVTNLQSATTLRHVKDFLLQNNFKAENKKQIIADYMQ